MGQGDPAMATKTMTRDLSDTMTFAVVLRTPPPESGRVLLLANDAADAFDMAREMQVHGMAVEVRALAVTRALLDGDLA